MSKMMITVHMTRDKNRQKYGEQAVMDLEEYLCGVVPSEISDSSPMEALKAQAIAARTFALSRIRAGAKMDDTANCQAFRSERMESPNSRRAIEETGGMVLMYNGQLVRAFYSASNGGITKRSGDVWSTHFPYYVSKNDEWDEAARKANPSIRASHGVGMSQVGAVYAARQGYSYSEILAFYYEETTLADNYGASEEENYIAVKASDLIREFKRMIGWKYEWGAAREGCVDCSGAFSYAYKRLGGYMYHGSNTMWRKYTTEKGKREEMTLLPGMAVFKWKKDGGPDSLGNYYHVGCYVGNGLVIEAQSKDTGVVVSEVSKWPYSAQLKETKYDVQEGEAEAMAVECRAKVTTESGKLNLRKAPNGALIIRIPRNEEIDVLKWDAAEGWALVVYNGKQGYASQEFLTRIEVEPPDEYLSGGASSGSVTLELPFADRDTAEQLLDALKDALEDASIWEEDV